MAGKFLGLRQPVHKQPQSLVVDSVASAAPGHQLRLPQRGTTFSVSYPSDYELESKYESKSAQAMPMHRLKPEDLVV
ncbi:hypothetical protein C8J57DRAFT_1515965 [Mycena rebaudengoi]|nr:hypothetical protein C8J57DRAFT_1515965 [Mycena rebaudengoi]